MLSFALLGTALAASPVSELSTVMSQESVPGWAISCSPVSDLVKIMRLFPLDDGRPRLAWSESQRVLIPLLKEGALTQAGIDTAGSISFSGYSKRGKTGNADVLGHFSIPFSGTADQADALIATIDPEATRSGPGTWQHTSSEEPLTIYHTESAIIIKSATAEPEKKTKPIPALLSDLPDAPGCAAFALVDGMDMATRMRSKPLKMQGMGMFLPTQEGTAHFRIKTGIALKADLDGAQVDTLLGSSQTKPTAVVLWAMDPLEMMGAIANLLPPIKSVKEMQKALSDEERPIVIPPGMVTVAFESGGKKAFAAVIPVHTRKGRKVWAGTLAKSLHKLIIQLKGPVEKTGRTRLVLGDKPGKFIYIATKRGLIYIASSPDLLEDMLRGDGKPWVSSELQTLARTSALAAEIETPPTQTSPATRVRAGLSLKEGLWDLQLQMNVPASKSNSIADVLETALALNTKMRSKLTKDLIGAGPEKELTDNIPLIYAAVNEYDLDHGEYLAVEPWPRSVSELTAEAVPWQAKRKKSKGFDKLNWAPDGDVMGTYWVQTGPIKNSFTVFGAIDADGDGNAVTYKWCHNCGGDKPSKVERVTPEGVY